MQIYMYKFHMQQNKKRQQNFHLGVDKCTKNVYIYTKKKKKNNNNTRQEKRSGMNIDLS